MAKTIDPTKVDLSQFAAPAPFTPIPTTNRVCPDCGYIHAGKCTPPSENIPPSPVKQALRQNAKPPKFNKDDIDPKKIEDRKNAKLFNDTIQKILNIWNSDHPQKIKLLEMLNKTIIAWNHLFNKDGK
jgi:hypothetical protein